MEEFAKVQFYVPNSEKLWKFLDHMLFDNHIPTPVMGCENSIFLKFFEYLYPLPL